MKETQLVSSIIKYGKLLPTVNIWRQNSGVTKYKNPNGTYRTVAFGFKGASDIIGINHDGRLIAIECKVGKNKLTDNQIAFKEMIIAFNGIYIEARSLEDVTSVLGKSNPSV